MRPLFLFSSLLLAFNLSGQETSKTFYSKILEHDVNILKANIGTFDNSDTINVLLLLDGDEYFGFAHDILSLYIGDEKIKPTILIGLPSTVQSRWKYYTPTNAAPYDNSSEEELKLFKESGKLNNYQKFIEEELLPSIEQAVNPKVIQRTLFGHSMGGLGAVSMFVRQTSIFENWIIASPSLLWDNHYLLEVLDKAQNENKTKYTFKSMYITTAENDIEYYQDNVDYFIEYMSQLTQSESTLISRKIYENESHYTVGLKSLFDGIYLILATENQ